MTSRLRPALAVVPGGEYAVEATTRAAAHLGLPGAGLWAGKVFRDKLKLRQLAARAGIRNPLYARVADVREAQAFFDTVSRPCVLKPTGRQASVGVQISLHGPQEQIADRWTWSADPDEGPRLPDRGIPSGVLIEEVVRGREFSVEMLYARGEPCFANVTAKRVLPGRFPVEIGHVVPAPLAEPLRSDLVASTQSLASEAGFVAGALHWRMDRR